MKRHWLFLVAFLVPVNCKDCSKQDSRISVDVAAVGQPQSNFDARVPDDTHGDALEIEVVSDLPPVTPDTIWACPEAVTQNRRGEPIGLRSQRIRYCWPGEPRCFCDVDGDCYAQVGYIPCTQSPRG